MSFWDRTANYPVVRCGDCRHGHRITNRLVGDRTNRCAPCHRKAAARAQAQARTTTTPDQLDLLPRRRTR